MFVHENSLQCLPDSRLCSPAHHYDPSLDVRAAADYYFVDYSSGLDAPFPCCLPGRRADSDWFGRPYQKLETCVMSFAVFPSASLCRKEEPKVSIKWVNDRCKRNTKCESKINKMIIIYTTIERVVQDGKCKF